MQVICHLTFFILLIETTIFVSKSYSKPVSEQVLAEDNKTNRMHDSLQLFRKIVNDEFLKQKPFIMFFNKSDLFREKIVKKSLKVA